MTDTICDGCYRITPKAAMIPVAADTTGRRHLERRG